MIARGVIVFERLVNWIRKNSKRGDLAKILCSVAVQCCSQCALAYPLLRPRTTMPRRWCWN